MPAIGSHVSPVLLPHRRSGILSFRGASAACRSAVGRHRGDHAPAVKPPGLDSMSPGVIPEFFRDATKYHRMSAYKIRVPSA